MERGTDGWAEDEQTDGQKTNRRMNRWKDGWMEHDDPKRHHDRARESRTTQPLEQNLNHATEQDTRVTRLKLSACEPNTQVSAMDPFFL